jgi:hypothetical protein
MTTDNTSIAMASARIVAGLAPKTVAEALELWDVVFAHMSNKTQGNEDKTVPSATQIGTTQGGRKMPIVSQAEIQSKIDAQRLIPVDRAEDMGVPEDAVVWAQKRGVKFLIDNRAAQKENPKRPAFKAANEQGFDIKDETGKSISYWGAR